MVDSSARGLPVARVMIALVIGCGGAPKPPAPIGNTAPGGAPAAHEVMVTLERTACYGVCPIYTLTVYRDGAVEWNGEDFVKVKGPATGQISADDVARLDELFATNHYFDLKDAYTSYDMTDHPSARTSYHGDGRAKAIDHYHGDTSAPPVLTTIEDGIDAIVHTEQWIGNDADRGAP